MNGGCKSQPREKALGHPRKSKGQIAGALGEHGGPPCPAALTVVWGTERALGNIIPHVQSQLAHL